MKLSTHGDNGRIGMMWTWKCLQLAYLLSVVLVIFCTSPQQVLRPNLNLVYEIENVFLQQGDKKQPPMIQQWLFKLVLDSYKSFIETNQYL
jgi:hypothetical protein